MPYDSKTLAQVEIARSYSKTGKHALALLHLNAAAVFASEEMPQRITDIRETIAAYRSDVATIRRHQEEAGL